MKSEKRHRGQGEIGGLVILREEYFAIAGGLKRGSFLTTRLGKDRQGKKGIKAPVDFVRRERRANSGDRGEAHQ